MPRSAPIPCSQTDGRAFGWTQIPVVSLSPLSQAVAVALPSALFIGAKSQPAANFTGSNL